MPNKSAGFSQMPDIHRLTAGNTYAFIVRVNAATTRRHVLHMEIVKTAVIKVLGTPSLVFAVCFKNVASAVISLVFVQC